MLFSKTVVAFASLAAFVSAQSSTTTSSGASPSESVKVHVIQAMTKDGKPVFDPAEVQADVGDFIQFQFHPMNHSVVQATFADPCIPISQSASGNGTTGFFSGFMPVDTSATVMPTFTIMVENTKPIWFYCSQGKHCQAGMVGAINPTAEKTLSDFQSRAAQAANNLSPGQNPGSGGTSSSVTASPTTMQTSATTGTSSTSTAITPPNAGAKLGASMPLVLAAVAASFFFL